MIFFYIYLKYEETKSKLYYILSGVIFGLILLTRYTGILAVIILFFYKFIKDKDLIKTIRQMILLFLIGLITFSIFPLIDYNLFQLTITHLFSTTSGIKVSILYKLIIVILWATPLLLGLTLLSLLRIEKKDLLFWIWIIIGFGFNLFIMPRGDFSRYFMIILPPLIILSSKYLSRIKLNRNNIYLGLASFIIFYILFFFINLNSRIIFTHFIDNYINSIKYLNFNFMFPYAISQGSWFGISFLAILIMLIFSLIFFILIFFRRYRKLALALFIGLGLSYNIFLNGEYLLHLSQPNINKIIYEMVDYVKENNLPYPVYSIDKGILDYLYDYNLYPDRKYIKDNYRIDDTTIDKISDKLSKEGGSIFFINFIAKIEKKEIDEIKGCKIIKTFSDKGIDVGYLYYCIPVNK